MPRSWRKSRLVRCAVDTQRVGNICSPTIYRVIYPAKLAGVLRTAIGPASLAGPPAVRSTRAQHLELDAAIDEPPQGVVLLPGGRPRGERAVTRLGVGIAPALLVGLRGGCIGLIDRTEPGASRLRMAERAVEFEARAARVPAARHDFRHVNVRVERVELRQPSLVRVEGDIHADHEDGVRGLARRA